MPNADEAPTEDALLNAYRRFANAYQLARALVFDRYPEGLPPREERTAFQQGRLDELASAESRARRRSPTPNAGESVAAALGSRRAPPA